MPTANWNLQSNMMQFTPIASNDPIADVIKQAFDMEFPVSGGWGYSIENAIHLEKTSSPHQQLQHTLASIRMHLEMSMTQPKANRYGGINLSETDRESLENQGIVHEKVIYHVTAMKESDYASFINAYKEGYGTEIFDMEAHFEARKEATLHRDITVWFYIEK